MNTLGFCSEGKKFSFFKFKSENSFKNSTYQRKTFHGFNWGFTNVSSLFDSADTFMCNVELEENN